MTTYISILRGINVSGQKNIKMAALKKMYEDLKFEHAQTYIQSGNIIFQSPISTKKDLEVKISNQIRLSFGFDVPVIVLDITELTEIIEENPYALDQNKNSSGIYVTFLSAKPSHIDHEILQKRKVIGEEFTLTEKAVYLYCPNGYGKTKLTNTFFENKLKVSATTRNWKTVNELLRIAENLKN